MISARVTVIFKEGVLDPQGKTIFNALQDLGYNSVKKVSTGKVFYLEMDSPNRDNAHKQIDDICQKLLSNPVIERYTIEVL